MFDHTHYVPILKGRLGEYTALGWIPDERKQGLTPMIDVPPVDWDFDEDRPSKTPLEHVQRIGRRIAEGWGSAERIFIDFLMMEESASDEAAPVRAVFRDATERGVRAVPVTGLARLAPYQRAVRDIAAETDCGACLRLTEFDDLDEAERSIGGLLDDLGLDPARVDLVLDMRSVSEDQRRTFAMVARLTLANVPFATFWRSVTLASGAFPRDLSGMSAASTATMPRSDWALWRSVVERAASIYRPPAFGDYGIASPDLGDLDVPPRYLKTSANLRYAQAEEWLVYKGRNIRQYGNEQFVDMCNAVTAQASFRRSHCEGDEMIAACAAGAAGPGNSMIRRRIGTAHHIVQTLDQLASLFGS